MCNLKFKYSLADCKKNPPTSNFPLHLISILNFSRLSKAFQCEWVSSHSKTGLAFLFPKLTFIDLCFQHTNLIHLRIFFFFFLKSQNSFENYENRSQNTQMLFSSSSTSEQQSMLFSQNHSSSHLSHLLFISLSISLALIAGSLR
jgi:hypothetical protein